jgi:iron complex outermembrane receptor protein
MSDMHPRTPMTGLVVRPMSHTRVAAIALAIGLVSAAQAAPALAQNLEADTVPTFNLDSLVVSVLGTPIRFGESPFAVSVLGESELRTGKTGMFMDEALRGLAGVQVQNRFNYAVGERVTIRGFGSRAQFGVRGINVTVDGIPATLADGQSTLDHIDIGSLGRVEALRGPASAIYGNASGGVLRFETELSPQTPFREEVTAVGGSHGLLRLQSTTTGTVGDAAYLLSLDRLEYDGFRYFGPVVADEGVVENADSAYGGARRMHVNARLEQEVAGGELGVTLNHLSLDSESAGSLARGPFNSEPDQIHPFYRRDMTGKEVQQAQLGIRWAGAVGAYTTDAAVYGLTRDFANPIPNEFVDADRRAAGVRLTVSRPLTPDFNVLVGAEYDRQDDDRREYFNLGGRPDTALINQTELVQSAGTFLQASVSPGERVNLVGAARYDFARYKVEDFLVRPAANNPDASGQRDMNNLSGSIGVHVNVMPELGVFANVGTSFETPTTVELGNQATSTGGFNTDLDPTTGRTFEAGFRGTASDRIAFEATGFLMQLENELVSGQNVDGVDYYRNVPKTERKGAEAVVRARLLDFVTGQISYSYVKPTFEEATDRYGVDISGKQVPGIAPTQLQASLRVTEGPWYLDLSAEYTGEMAVNDRNCLVVLVAGDCPDTAAGGRQDGFTRAYTVVGVRVGGSAVELGGFEVSPFFGVDNLVNRRYMASVVPNAFAPVPNHTNVRFYEPGPGRTFYLGGTVAVSR